MNQSELFFPRPAHHVQEETAPQAQPNDDAPFIFEDATPEP
jgi:hypothetical protein